MHNCILFCIKLSTTGYKSLGYTKSARNLGGAGNKVLRVIEGDAHAYVFASPGTKKWDTCAPEAVLVAMGGALTGKLR